MSAPEPDPPEIPADGDSLAETVFQPSGVTTTVPQSSVLGDAPQTPLMRGAQHYAVDETIASGGMGEIIAARDVELDRAVVLKRLRPELRGDAGALRRLLEEAQVTGQLSHPGIVAVHEVGRLADGQPYFSMARVEGQTLTQLIEELRGGRRAFGIRRVQIMLRVCETIAYAHAQGILHRDIKPDNIMLGRFGEVYVMDWGLAKRQGRADDEVKTRRLTRPQKILDATSVDRTTDGEVLGTPLYMPPEQALGQVEEIDERSDIYSLGATFFELLLLRPAFERCAPRELMMQIVAGNYDRPGTKVSDPYVPEELKAVLAKAMAREPEDRYADVGALAADVEAFLEGRVVRAARYSLTQRLVRVVHRYRTACVMLILIGASALVAEHARRYMAAADERVESVKQSFRDELELRRRASAATLHLQAGNYEAAVAAFTSALALADDRAELYQGRGLAKRRLLDYVGALADYDRAIALDPDFGEAYKQRGTTYVQAGDLRRALADYDEAIRVNREDASTYRYRCNARLLAGQTSRALEDARRAVRDPTYWQAQCSMAVAQAVRGSASAARAALELAEHHAGGRPRLIVESSTRVETLIAMPLLSDLLKDPKPALRRYAARALGDLGPLGRGRLAVVALPRLLDDQSTAVRKDVAVALARIGPAKPSLVAKLRRLLDTIDTAPTAVRALVELGPAGIPELLAILEREDLAVYHPRVRTALARLAPQTIDAALRAKALAAVGQSKEETD